ncbi:MAG TPA: hypothetical protein PLD14_02155 [Candidatus Pacearchaeota archaeon]|nr:hypothetical protein [Candidatus Pacearchaeota archaeon]HPR80004.1 hypothetical protein [Candidatus Pacearchaeota archaeon]
MNEPKEPLLEQPERTRAEIAEEELAKMKIENTKHQSDYKPEFDQYLANKGEDENIEEESSIKQPSTEKVKTPEEVKKPEEIKNPEKVKTPEEIKSEETKKIDLEAKQEKEARTERAIENLKALFDNKNKLFAQKEKQKSLSYKLKALFGDKDGESVTADEYGSVYDEYGKSLGEVEALTGKSKDQIIKEYLSGKERNEDSVENVNKNLDDIEAGLEKTEEGQSKEKKDLIEKLTGIKDERVKFAIKVAIAGGMIAFPVAGIAAGALGMGLGEALIGYSFIHYSTALGLAVGNTAFAVGGIGGGGALLHKAIKDLEDAESRIPQDKNKEQEEIPTPESPISKTESIEKKEDNSGIEKKLIKDDEFKQVNNFEELYKKIDEVYNRLGIDGAETLKNRILYLSQKRSPFEGHYDDIPVSGGLNAKVQELIKKDTKEKGLDWVE